MQNSRDTNLKYRAVRIAVESSASQIMVTRGLILASMDHSSCDCSITSTRASRNDNYHWEQFVSLPIKVEYPPLEPFVYLCLFLPVCVSVCLCRLFVSVFVSLSVSVFFKMFLDWCVKHRLCSRWDILHCVIKTEENGCTDGGKKT